MKTLPWATALWLLVTAAIGGGCASLDRGVFGFNMVLGERVYEPLARGYDRYVPVPVQTGLRNVTDNAMYTETLANDALQLKWRQLPGDVARILLNTTIGIVGIFDPASAVGIAKNREDFGQTLGVWGVPPGPYFNVPFIGPSSLRDIWRYPARYATSVFTYTGGTAVSLPIGVMNHVFERWAQTEHLETVMDHVDPYLFVKTSYTERRQFLVYDGNLPAGEMDEELEYLDQLEDLDVPGELSAPASPELIGPPPELVGPLPLERAGPVPMGRLLGDLEGHEPVLARGLDLP
jgi:phospholipid-binding lipoprotein MlaA